MDTNRHENWSNLGDRRSTRSRFVYFVYFVVKLYGMVVFVVHLNRFDLAEITLKP